MAAEMAVEMVAMKVDLMADRWAVQRAARMVEKRAEQMAVNWV